LLGVPPAVRRPLVRPRGRLARALARDVREEHRDACPRPPLRERLTLQRRAGRASLHRAAPARQGGRDGPLPGGEPRAHAQRLAAPPGSALRDRPRLVRALPRALARYHESQCTIESSGLRLPGLKSVPMVYASGMSATCVTSSYGMPRISAASRSCMRWNVVHTVPSPRARAASMNDHAAGMIEPNIEATSGFDFPSYRPMTHGITCTGTSWMWSARWTTASPMRAIWP